MAGLDTVSGTLPRPAIPAPRGLVLASCCTALFLTGIDTTITNAGLPSIGRDLHAGTAGLQWVVAAYTVPLASLLLAAGSLADRAGRRAVLLAALAVFATGSWACSIAPSMTWLAAARALQGCGAAGLAPSALGIITAVYPHGRERARAMGTWDACLGLGMAAGPPAGGFLVQAAGWRSVFWVNVPASLLAIAAVALFVPEARDLARRPASPAGQLLSLVLLGSLAGGIIEGPALGWNSPAVTGALGVAAGTGAGAGLIFLARPRQTRAPGPQAVLSGRAAAGLAGGLLATAALAGWLFLITLYLQDARGLQPVRAALVIIPMPAMMTAGSAAAGRIIARTGPRPLFACGGAAIAGACAVLCALAGTVPLAAPGGACALFGLGMGLASMAITHSVMSAPGLAAGLASGVNSAARQTGATIGVAVAGTVLASAETAGGSIPSAAGFGHASTGAWLVLAACGAGVAGLGMTGLPPRRRLMPAPPGQGRGSCLPAAGTRPETQEADHGEAAGETLHEA